MKQQHCLFRLCINLVPAALLLLLFVSTPGNLLLPAQGAWPTSFQTWEEGRPRVHLGVVTELNSLCGPSNYLAMRAAVAAVNSRNASLCPSIGRLKHDFQISYAIRNSGGNPYTGSQAVLDLLGGCESGNCDQSGGTNGQQQVAALVGPALKSRARRRHHGIHHTMPCTIIIR